MCPVRRMADGLSAGCGIIASEAMLADHDQTLLFS